MADNHPILCVGEVTIIIQPISLLIYNDLIIVMTSQLLVTVDSLRYDHFHLMENTREYLDQEHESAFSVSTATGGSFPGIICSQYPKGSDVENMIEFPSEIEEYKIGITTNNFLTERYGYGSSFDYFECPKREKVGIKTRASKKFSQGGLMYQVLTFGWNNIQKVRDRFKSVEDTFRSSDNVISTFLNNIKDEEDWFGWIHLMEPHHPYEPENGDEDKILYQNTTRKVINGNGDEKDKNIVREGYRNEITELDESLTRLWSELPNDTEIIFTSDHGELLGEYNNTWGHPGMMAPELLHIPFATKNIDVSDKNIISHIDIGSIFLDKEFGQGRLNRQYAYATYGDNKSIITQDLIYDGDKCINMEGEYIEMNDNLSHLHKKWSSFEPTNTRYKRDGLEEDLEDLGYL